MSNKYRCDYCLKPSKDPVNLVCEHILCFSCGSALLKVDIENDNENKYRISCPKCKRVTYTYDINNLLLSSSCSVTRGFSTENDDLRKKKGSATARRSQRSEDKHMKKMKSGKVTPSHHGHQSDPNSCKQHKLPFNLYCETESVTICQRCRPSHNSSHKVYDLEVALPHIIKKNIQFRHQGKQQLSEIDLRIGSFLKTREEYEESKQRLSTQIHSEFRIIEGVLQKRKEELLNELQFFFRPKVEEIDSIIADMTELRTKLKLVSRTVPETADREVYIYRGFETIKECLLKLQEQINSLSKLSVSLEKGGSAQGIRTQLRNFLCLNLWTKKNAGKLLTPSQYFSQLKEMTKHRLSHSSSNFSELDNERKTGSGSKPPKLREYGI